MMDCYEPNKQIIPSKAGKLTYLSFIKSKNLSKKKKYFFFFFVTFRYSAGEIHFNLMALVSDRKACYEKRIQELFAQTEVSFLLEFSYICTYISHRIFYCLYPCWKDCKTSPVL
jgi:hypothetical protein